MSRIKFSNKNLGKLSSINLNDKDKNSINAIIRKKQIIPKFSESISNILLYSFFSFKDLKIIDVEINIVQVSKKTKDKKVFYVKESIKETDERKNISKIKFLKSLRELHISILENDINKLDNSIFNSINSYEIEKGKVKESKEKDKKLSSLYKKIKNLLNFLNESKEIIKIFQEKTIQKKTPKLKYVIYVNMNSEDIKKTNDQSEVELNFSSYIRKLDKIIISNNQKKDYFNLSLSDENKSENSKELFFYYFSKFLTININEQVRKILYKDTEIDNLFIFTKEFNPKIKSIPINISVKFKLNKPENSKKNISDVSCEFSFNYKNLKFNSSDIEAISKDSKYEKCNITRSIKLINNSYFVVLEFNKISPEDLNTLKENLKKIDLNKDNNNSNEINTKNISEEKEINEENESFIKSDNKSFSIYINFNKLCNIFWNNLYNVKSIK
jgi:hypothetical protein